jgi:hypothetical protein
MLSVSESSSAPTRKEKKRKEKKRKGSTPNSVCSGCLIGRSLAVSAASSNINKRPAGPE